MHNSTLKMYFEQTDVSQVQDMDIVQHCNSSTSLADVIQKSPRCGRLLVFQSTHTLETCMQALCEEDQIVLIGTQDEHRRHFVLSQMDILHFLSSSIQELEEAKRHFLSCTLEELGLIKLSGSPVVIVHNSERVLDVLAKMFREKVASVAVFNDSTSKELVATFSTFDLQGLAAQDSKNILLPLSKFFEVMTGTSPPLPPTCSNQTKLGEILSQLSLCQVHRLWVVNSATRHPIGVITLTHIIHFIWHFVNFDRS